MKRTKAMLAMPAARGIRLVAIELLGDAAKAAARLAEGHDEEALHDFRVAIRRLRSWLRAFEEALDDDVGRKDRRRLRALVRATNAGRDLDVQLEWLAGAAKGLDRKRKRGASWLIEHLTAERRAAGDPVSGDLLADFSDEQERLEKRLSTWAQPVREPDVAPPTLAEAIAAEIGPHVDALGRALAAVKTLDDETPAHEARIAAKRLRYLMEPAAKHLRGGTRILERLRGLQDELGALHDAHVLAHRLRALLEAPTSSEAAVRSDGSAGTSPAEDGAADDPVPRDGIRSVAVRLRTDTQSIFRRVHRQWQRSDDTFATFSRDVAAFTARLEREGR